MIVFHGSSLEVKNPEIMYSKAYLDFGKGFYVTTFQKQAEQWALRKGIRQGKDPVVNEYILLDEFNNYRVLSFEKENEKWLDFVCECRRGNELNQEYDIIIGNVADDDVFKTVDMYFRGLWSKEQALEELRYYKMNDQICFVNQETLNGVLLFQKSYKVGVRMVDRNVLAEEYKQNLEENIIAYLSEIKHLELRISMDIYYRSRLAGQISDGIYGIENLDYKYLVQDLIENEPELFI